MNDCYSCKYAIGDYEEYYGGYREHIVVGCKLDRDPDTCGEEDDDEMSEVRSRHKCIRNTLDAGYVSKGRI